MNILIFITLHFDAENFYGKPLQNTAISTFSESPIEHVMLHGFPTEEHMLYEGIYGFVKEILIKFFLRIQSTEIILKSQMDDELHPPVALTERWTREPTWKL